MCRHVPWWLLPVLGLAVHVAGCSHSVDVASDTAGAEPKPEPGFFVDRTAASGVQATYRNGREAGQYAILESLGGGVGLLDYDRDGLLDIFVLCGGYYDGPDKKQIKGHPSRLFRNLGGWKFQDVTAEVGLDRPLFYTHGCAVADYDNDGWPDLLVTGYGRVALYHNEAAGEGKRRFVEVTQQAGLTEGLWNTSAAWGDLDGNGYPDLYLTRYVDWSWENNPPCKDYQGGGKRDVCPPRSFSGLPDALFLNSGKGTFRNAGKEAGLRPDGKGLGVIIVDINDDGRPDIYVANDTVDNFLYLNHGQGKLEEVGVASGVARDDLGTPNGSMGVDAADYDGSGRFSLFTVNYQHEAHALYRNTGKNLFLYASRSAGITSIGLLYVGFGTCFFDFDRDGDEDLFITNGHVVYFPPLPGKVKQRPVLLENLRQPSQKPYEVRFADSSARAGPFFQAEHLGRGMALGDLDNDGKLDLVVSHVDEPVALLQNTLDNGHHWLGVELVGKPYRDAVGARLTLDVGGQKLIRTIKGGGSYLSANDHRVVFGLGRHEKAGRLTVRWPSGKTQTWEGLAVDRYWRLVEGEEPAQPYGAKRQG